MASYLDELETMIADLLKKLDVPSDSSSASTRTRNSSVDDIVPARARSLSSQQTSATTSQQSLSSSVESLDSATLIQSPTERSMEIDRDETGSFAESSELLDDLQESRPSDMDPRDLEIMHLTLTNESLRDRIKRLEEEVRIKTIC